MFVTFLLLFCGTLWTTICVWRPLTAFKGFKRNDPFLASLKTNQTSLGEKNEDTVYKTKMSLRHLKYLARGKCERYLAEGWFVVQSRAPVAMSAGSNFEIERTIDPTAEKNECHPSLWTTDMITILKRKSLTWDECPTTSYIITS